MRRLFAVVLCCIHLHLSAEEAEFPRLQLTAGVESSQGESFWDMRFLFEEDGFGLMSGRSLLDWKDLDATSFWIGADVELSPVWGLAARFSFGRIRGGSNTDTDWLGEDPARTADIPFAESIAETDGDLRSGSFDVWHRFLVRPRYHLDALLGFLWHEEHLRDRNGISTFDLLEGPMFEPFEDLDSRFDFGWSALRIGLRGENALRENLSFCWKAVGLIGVKYEGEGYWNLRDDFRAEAPQFVQEGSGGYGADLYAGLRWNFRPGWSLEGGVKHLRLLVEDGSEITYFADGTAGETEIREAQTRRTGFSLAVSYDY